MFLLVLSKGWYPEDKTIFQLSFTYCKVNVQSKNPHVPYVDNANTGRSVVEVEKHGQITMVFSSAEKKIQAENMR